MRPLRVAFAGASGTGKTRLLARVAERYGLRACPVGARSTAAAMGFANPYDAPERVGWPAFQRKLFEDKRAWEAGAESFATDRSAFDNLAYCSMHGARMELWEVSEYELAMRRYTHVFYLPLRVHQNLAGDPFRVQQRGYHYVFDVLLRALLHDFGVPFYELSVPLDERAAAVDEVLGKAGDR